MRLGKNVEMCDGADGDRPMGCLWERSSAGLILPDFVASFFLKKGRRAKTNNSENEQGSLMELLTLIIGQGFQPLISVSNIFY